MLWVDISLKILFSKNLHVKWMDKLKQCFEDKVGGKFKVTDDLSISTCVLWVPSVSMFCMPLACSPAKQELIMEVGKKRVWNSIGNSDRESLSALQYNILPLPDLWFEYSYQKNEFTPGSLIRKIHRILEVNLLSDQQSVMKFDSVCEAEHYSMRDKSTPFCMSNYTDRPSFWRILFCQSTFRCHAKQLLKGDVYPMTEKKWRRRKC